jgi:hypothetical protein
MQAIWNKTEIETKTKFEIWNETVIGTKWKLKPKFVFNYTFIAYLLLKNKVENETLKIQNLFD